MKIGEAKQVVGTLSFPSKLPGTSFALPASRCKTGAKLAKIAGTVCSLCYALRGGGSYNRSNPVKAQFKRLHGISDPLWVEAMATLLQHTHSKPKIRVDLGFTGVKLQRNGGSRTRFNESGWHRWHDSGDIQSVEHLSKICEVARLTPKIKHWLPTQELGIVSQFIKSGGVIPDNLAIRISSVKIDDVARRNWPLTASVFMEHDPKNSYVCPAPKQGRVCGKCRACWSKDVPHISYALH